MRQIKPNQLCLLMGGKYPVMEVVTKRFVPRMSANIVAGTLIRPTQDMWEVDRLVPNRIIHHYSDGFKREDTWDIPFAEARYLWPIDGEEGEKEVTKEALKKYRKAYPYYG